MPLLKHAIKKMRQDQRRESRRLPQKSHMKAMVKKVVDLASAGNIEEAAKVLPLAFKAVDLAAKKHIIHPNTASRKKSRMSRLVAGKKK